MKKTTLFLASALLSLSTAFAQTEETSAENDMKDYDKWSIDIAAGLNNASRPYSQEGIYTDHFADFSANVGVRYMFNDKFGLRADVGFGSINADDDAALDFSTDYTRFQLETVFNLGSVFNFREFTNRFNLLFHAGAGLNYFNYQEGALTSSNQTVLITGGITPQVKISKSIALNLDLSITGHTNQDYTLDGYAQTNNLDFDGMMVNATVGISFYIGDNDTHADWYNAQKDSKLANKAKDLEERLAKLEDDLQDDDRDGVANYLDIEPNTINGVAVNSKGQAVDKNKNQIPDELESSLNKLYLTKSDGNQMINNAGLALIKNLANSGSLSVYFDFNSQMPTNYSTEAINSIMLYLREKSNSTVTLTGFADEIGNPEYNQKLALKRAEAVKTILVDAGIAESRIAVTSGGVDDSVNKSSQNARQLVRKVVFDIK